jgi:hypothetical protein
MKRFEYAITEKKEIISLGRVSIIRNVKPGSKGVYAEYNILFEYMPIVGNIQIDYKKQIKYCSHSIVDLCENMGVTLDLFVSRYKKGFKGYFHPLSTDAVIEFNGYKSEYDARELNRKIHQSIMKRDRLTQSDGFLSLIKNSENESIIGFQLIDTQFTHNDLIEFGMHMAFHERKWIAENITDSEYIPHEDEIHDLRPTVIEELKSFIEKNKLP